MRFDLLDEYSTLVPFGLGISRNRTFQDPTVAAKEAKRGPITNFASLALLRKFPGALWQMMLSTYRHLAEKCSYPFLGIRRRQR